jgi:hypothetical protein
MRDSMIFYRSFYEAVKELNKEQQADIYNAIFAYSLDGENEDLSGIVKTVFTLIKPQLDANNKRFENGAKGGRPKQNKTENKPNNNQNKTKTEPNNNNNVNNNVNENVNNNENENVNNNENQNSLHISPKVENFSFKNSLIEIGIEKQIIEDWLKVRKNKKAANTQTAFEAIVREIEKSGMTPNECIKKSVENSWSGFKNEWIKNAAFGKTNTQGAAHVHVEKKRTLEDWIGNTFD